MNWKESGGWREIPAVAIFGGLVRALSVFAKLRASLRKACPVKIYDFGWVDDAEYQVYFDASAVNDDIRHILFEAAGNPDAHVVVKE